MAASIENPNGKSPILLICEHASCFIQPHLDNLGLNEDAAQSHIAWDPGALGVALALSKRLDATLIAGTISRLVYDCNRPPASTSAIPVRSEVHDIPGNKDLKDPERQWRIENVYERFRNSVLSVIKSRPQTILVTIHSFTPIFHGKTREVEIGILDGFDRRLAIPLIKELKQGQFITFANEPYGPNDGVAHSLQIYGIDLGHLNVMIEIRNDLIANTASEIAMADYLAGPIERAVQIAQTTSNLSTSEQRP